MIVGTAGHVDHGKTTLVRALTGIDTDRLPEEQRRGMTIELGYAYAGRLGFVDVPGHERFVHTMLAGAGGIDAALLVIAADDGVMPQTREHAAILTLLGIDRGVVAITRIDRAPERIDAVADDARALLAGTPLDAAPILPVCAPTGEGIGALRDALLALGERAREATGYARLAVDRVFSLAGAGLVVAGTLLAGAIGEGDDLVVSPAGIAVRVRSLHANNRPARQAVAGQRVAVRLAGLAREQVSRGDWVLAPFLDAPTSLLDIRLDRIAGAPAPRDGQPVHVHHAATHVTGRLALLDGDAGEGAGRFGRLTLDRPIAALCGDRVVLRDAGATATIGGGFVLDPWPARRGARTPARLARLGRLDGDAAGVLRAELAAGPVVFDAFARGRNLAPAIAASVLGAAGGVRLGPFALDAGSGENLSASLIAALAAEHAARPHEPGVTADQLRRALAPPPSATLFRALLDAALAARAIAQDGGWLRLPSHRASLSPQDERLWSAVAPLLAAERFRPPRTRDLAGELRVPEPAMRAALKRLARAGRLVEVAHDHFFHAATVAEMAGTVASLAAGDGRFTTAAFRDRLGNGRKVALQVLEYFDAAGLTRRDGDARVVRADRIGLFGSPADAA